MLKHISELDEIPERLQRFLFKKIFKLAEITNYNPKDRQEYEESLKEYRDYYNTIATAEKEAQEKGLKQGKKEEKIETAKEGFKAGLDIHLIATLTKLSIEELQEIKNSIDG